MSSGGNLAVVSERKKIVTMRNLHAMALVVGLSFLGIVANAQGTQHVVVHAGHVLDVKSGKMLADQALVIEDGKIVSMSSSADAKAPADAVHIELPNATLLPGLIDAHTHLTSDPTFGYEELGISLPRETLTGAKNARLTLQAGFTTVRNVGASGYSDVALRDAINAGDVPGPRMLVSGPPLGITGGHCDNNLLPFEYHAVADGVADGIAGVQHKVRENIKYGSDLIKVCATGGVLSKGDDPQASARPKGRRARSRSAGHSLGVTGGSRFDRARIVHRRCRNRRDEKEWHVSCAHALSGGLVPGKRGAKSCAGVLSGEGESCDADR
jgi:imidazolonepropionase-like amidohydrolase